MTIVVRSLQMRRLHCKLSMFDGTIYKNMLIYRGNVLKYDRFPRIIE